MRQTRVIVKLGGAEAAPTPSPAPGLESKDKKSLILLKQRLDAGNPNENQKKGLVNRCAQESGVHRKRVVFRIRNRRKRAHGRARREAIRSDSDIRSLGRLWEAMSVEQWEALNRKINTETLNRVENKEEVTDVDMTRQDGSRP